MSDPGEYDHVVEVRDHAVVVDTKAPDDNNPGSTEAVRITSCPVCDEPNRPEDLFATHLYHEHGPEDFGLSPLVGAE